jgi:hypothetical protein
MNEIRSRREKTMETKYGKYLVTEPRGKDTGAFPRWILYGGRDFGGAEFSMRIHYLAEPYFMIKEAHSHDFDQFYLICGADFAHPWDFQAEIEFYLGKEEEKHIITAPTAVHVPKGMIHGPLNFKKIDRPILFIDSLLSAEYATAGQPRR